MARPPARIENGDFEQGLAAWRVVSGTAFAGQPVSAASVGAAQVRIHGEPPVRLGGDYWHTPYPLGHHGSSLVFVVSGTPGVLESDPFSIGDRWLGFRLGGSAGGTASVELRVPRAVALAAGIKRLDQPDSAGYVAIVRTDAHGSDVLREEAWDLLGKAGGGGPALAGATAKVRLRVRPRPGRGPARLLVDHVRLAKRRPAPERRPLWGWADIHCHPMAQAGFGQVLAGHAHGPLEDLGTCLPIHGHRHGNPLRPVSAALEGGRANDGALATTGWTLGTAAPGDELGFRGWPAFDEITHIKTHQAWIRRAWEGGQRLMVALVVHNEMLAGISNAAAGILTAQSDRDTVEPQVRMLHEFIAHNRDWCGLARTPADARALIEANRMAFVLGIETDSINGWVHFEDFPQDDTPASRVAIHDAIHPYFGYLRALGIVQINLLHLTDNAFGGMALYDLMFLVNSFQRTGRFPDVEDGFTGRAPNEAISRQATVGSAAWHQLEPLIRAAGINVPPPAGVPPFPVGHRNARGLTVAGEVALLEAMRLGMVIDTDHMSERSFDAASAIALKAAPGRPYPLVAAHNGARALAPAPLAASAPAAPDARRNPHAWASEAMKSDTQLGVIRETRGIFGHGVAGTDSRQFGGVPNDCPGTSKTVAQGLQYVWSRLELPVALGTDWNALLPGPGPRFGPRAAHGVSPEVPLGDAAWQDERREERRTGAAAQRVGVRYDTPVTDWRAYRFPADGLDAGTPLEPDGHLLWQAVALARSGADLTAPDVVGRLAPDGPPGLAVLELALGLAGLPGTAGSVHHRAGQVAADPAIDPAGEPAEVQRLVGGLAAVLALWATMTAGSPAPPLRRDTAGPVREFDVNLDGLAHYGMLPDLLQDLRNVGLDQAALEALFRSAEHYVDVWERSVAAGASIPH